MARWNAPRSKTVSCFDDNPWRNIFRVIGFKCAVHNLDYVLREVGQSLPGNQPAFVQVLQVGRCVAACPDIANPPLGAKRTLSQGGENMSEINR